MYSSYAVWTNYRFTRLPVGLFLFLVMFNAWCEVVSGENAEHGPESTLLDEVLHDYRSYYSSSILTQTGLVVVFASALANSRVDQAIIDGVEQQDERRRPVDKTFSAFNRIGDIAQLKLSVPIYVGAMLLGRQYTTEVAGVNLQTWGNMSLRTLLLGAPQQLVLTNVIGGQRPSDGDSRVNLFDSRFDDDYGVSGHAFFGAIPFLTAANMSQNNVAKYSFYALSTLPGMARINNQKHYPYQVVLGWSLAWFSSRSVFSGKAKNSLLVVAYGAYDTPYFGINYEF